VASFLEKREANMNIDDATLVNRFQMGDKTALDALVQRHHEKAYKYAYRLTRDADQACDVVAEAFVRVCKSLGRFEGKSAFSTWLHRVVTNCFLDLRKRASSRPSLSLDSILQDGAREIEQQISDSSLAPHEMAARHERENRLAKAIDTLPEHHRAIIVMFHVESLSYEEIADLLDLPIGTVKSRLNRARLSLRDVLMEDRDAFLAA
jgi:RNA polymerase sigma-70 factor (ECF subfamily)